MINFKQHVELEENRNTHLTHIEETIITDGYKGAVNAIEFLKSVSDMLGGSSRSATNITTKWDGAPAIFCGIDPEDKKFFVATKSVFNKSPKLNKTNADIRKNHSGGLVEKLEVALKELSKLGIKGVIQGDMMYTKSDLKSMSHDGEKYITFQPNTIVYAVPEEGPLGKFIKKTNMGIIFHTTYTGKKLEDMKASFNINISRLKKNKSIWFDDASYKDVSGSVTMTSKETEKLNGYISKIETQSKSVKTYLDKMSENFDEKNRFSLWTNFKTHLNVYFRSEGDFPNANTVVSEFKTYWNTKMNKEIDSKKTEVSKDKYREILKDGINKIDSSKSDIIAVTELYINIMEAKNVLVQKLSKVKSIGTFLRTDDGLKTTEPEGFVAVDRIKGNAVKLVNRLEFSRANFTAAKNWVSK
jgi:hypothetical protein|tara:strand:+ start:2735 stop:3976 length:1242 start_codon:yes stop_codon:yes gene_type:complete